HRLEVLRLAVEDADAGRAIHLVPGEGVEVAVEFADVDLEMRDRLGPVDKYRDAAVVSGLDDLLDRVDRAQRVGDVGQRQQLHARTEKPIELVESEIARVIDRNDLERRAVRLSRLLPGNDVRVMFESGEDDLVAGPERLAETRGDEVDRVG